MPLSLATFRDQSILERISLFIGAMFPDTIIRMVVAFVAGEPPRCSDDWSRCTLSDVFPDRRHPRQLVPLSRRFVPEPVEMTYIVTDTWLPATKQAAGLPRAIGHFIMEHFIRDRGGKLNFYEQMCSICDYGPAVMHPVGQVTLQTRLRRPFWPNTEAFRVFISDRLVIVNRLVCSNCLRRCNKPNVPGAGWCRCPQDLIHQWSRRMRDAADARNRAIYREISA